MTYIGIRMHAIPKAPGLALLDMTLLPLGALGEFGLLFGRLLSKDSDSWNFHVNLTLKELCQLKEEHTPKHDSFPQIVNFISV
jgi:hypothetical protein